MLCDGIGGQHGRPVPQAEPLGHRLRRRGQQLHQPARIGRGDRLRIEIAFLPRDRVDQPRLRLRSRPGRVGVGGGPALLQHHHAGDARRAARPRPRGPAGRCAAACRTTSAFSAGSAASSSSRSRKGRARRPSPISASAAGISRDLRVAATSGWRARAPPRHAVDARGQRRPVLAQRQGGELAVEGERKRRRRGEALAARAPQRTAPPPPRPASRAPRAGDDAAAALAQAGEVPLGARPHPQPAQRDEAGEELGLLPRLARLADAVPGGDGVGRARIAEAQQLAGEHLPLAPEGARRLRRQVGRRAAAQAAAASASRSRRRSQRARSKARPASPRAASARAGVSASGPVGGVGEPRGGDALPRRVEERHRPRRRARLPRQGQPVEAAPVLVRSELRAVALKEAAARPRRRPGASAQPMAQHLRRLRLLAGAGQRLGQALVALQGARRAGGEPLQGQRVVGSSPAPPRPGGRARPAPAIPDWPGRRPRSRRPGRRSCGIAAASTVTSLRISGCARLGRRRLGLGPAPPGHGRGRCGRRRRAAAAPAPRGRRANQRKGEERSDDSSLGSIRRHGARPQCSAPRDGRNRGPKRLHCFAYAPAMPFVRIAVALNSKMVRPLRS